MKGHKDFVLLTVLYTTKPGLEVFTKANGWQKINPKSGYVIVNIANCLEVMTGGSYLSALHRVNLPTDEERISVASFLGPNPGIPIVDYSTGNTLYPSFKEFSDEQMKQTYDGF